MRRIKLTLAMSLLLLTALGMLLTNVVILPFWAGDMLTRESRHLRQVLVVVRSAGTAGTNLARSRVLEAFLAETPEGCLLLEGQLHRGGQSHDDCGRGLLPLVEAAAHSGTMQTSREPSSLLGVFSSPYLYVALPASNAESLAVGAGIPIAGFAQSLTSKERIIALYLLFNALVLSALAFFRLLNSYVRPVDRMIAAAENYQGEGFSDFGMEKSANELEQLGESIQTMVRRIEADKGKLAVTVAELAESNRQLRENQAEMVRAEKLASVGRLAAGLAHEIGNPLGVAQGYLQLMAMEGSEPGEIADYAGRAGKELARVDGLIRQLLDFARSGRSRREQFDLHALLAEMADSLCMQPFLEGIALALDLAIGSSTVFADPEQLRQVVLNCLINSADAIRARKPAEGGLIRLVTATVTEAGRDMLQLNIIDNGEGIDQAMIEAVFDPFFTTKEPGAGTGLGLSVSLSLIESMGGRMRIESTKGEGATVILRLPVDAAGGGAAAGPVEATHA